MRISPHRDRQWRGLLNRRRIGVIGFVALLALLSALSSVPTLSQKEVLAAPVPAYVQGGFMRVASGTQVSAAFTQATTSGNTIVAYVIWSQPGSVTLSDTRGNAYHAVSAPVVWGSNWSAQVLYASGIAGGADTITATFSTAVSTFGLLYIHEYAGLDTAHPLDGTHAAAGSGSTLNSGSIATTNASDLLFSAAASDNSVQSSGAGFAARLTDRDNMTADRSVSTIGQYAATGTQNGQNWVSHIVALRAAASVPTATPTSTPTATASPTATNTATPTSTPTTSAPASSPGSTAAPAFVQADSAEVRSGSSVSTAFTSPNTAGNTAIVYVLWSNTDTATVADSRGNIYRPVSAPVQWGSGWAAQVFYAPGIGSGSNTVTATFSTTIRGFALIYIHEYSGLNTSMPVDVSHSAAGASGSLDSGLITTGNANDLLFTAGASDNIVTSLASPFVARSDMSGNVTGDSNVTSSGQYRASATQNGNAWVMQLVAFRGGAQATSPAVPAATSTPTPTSTPTRTATPTSTRTPTSTPTATATSTSVPASAPPPPPPATGGPVFPLKASANNRFLVDQTGVPFLMQGDSPQALIGNLSPSDADFFFADRQAAGYNAVWVNLLCDSYTGCNSNGTTFDGIPPFTTPGDLSTPNEAYFSRVDTIIQDAANHHITILLDPIETGGWLSVAQSNGSTKDYNYGAFLGRRYRNFPNLVWLSGNDFQTWSTTSDDTDIIAVAQGIKDNDPNHIHTVELNFFTSNSIDDQRWVPLINLNASYTYNATYDMVLQAYNRNLKPVFMVEADYEGEHNASNLTLRRQEYWSLLSGATGQLFGNHFTSFLLPGWKSNMDTPGSNQFALSTRLFGPRKWFNLVPDQSHTFVTAGFGTYDANNAASDFLTAALTPDGTLGIAYMPTSRVITVNLSKFSAPVTARWYDPANGTFTSIAGSPFANSGSRQFSPPGANADGDGDWLLVLETSVP